MSSCDKKVNYKKECLKSQRGMCLFNALKSKTHTVKNKSIYIDSINYLEGWLYYSGFCSGYSFNLFCFAPDWLARRSKDTGPFAPNEGETTVIRARPQAGQRGMKISFISSPTYLFLDAYQQASTCSCVFYTDRCTVLPRVFRTDPEGT